eukprot:TRINITY_DN12798_c0_g1_i1.p5 TRINITY_DN12798_c0_g1~~TRINITY_DN12798_c0_g1_i1.p5  ORF type:complete len:108 (+),score=7.19 TRINITY_DN12798_c0_g1_i1:566-889(+)
MDTVVRTHGAAAGAHNCRADAGDALNGASLGATPSPPSPQPSDSDSLVVEIRPDEEVNWCDGRGCDSPSSAVSMDDTAGGTRRSSVLNIREIEPGQHRTPRYPWTPR